MHRVADSTGVAVAKVPEPVIWFIIRQVVEVESNRVKGILCVTPPGLWEIIEAEGIAGRPVKGPKAVIGVVGYGLGVDGGNLKSTLLCITGKPLFSGL
jgi:hypothetical protein